MARSARPRARSRFVPADPNRFEIALPGFRSQSLTLDESHGGKIDLRLVYEPRHVLNHANAVDTTPLTHRSGRMFLVDRGGNVTAMRPGAERPDWSYKTGDLSGLLSRAFDRGSEIVFASLDGELRALTAENGRVAWTVPDLPTETEPVMIDRYLAIATTDDRLCIVDLDDRSKSEMTIDSGGRTRLLAAGQRLIVVTTSGISAYAVPSLKQLWSTPLQNLTELAVTATDNNVVAIDDHGNIVCLMSKDGSENWRGIEDATVIGSPVVDGNAVLVLSEQRLVRMSLADGSRRRATENVASRWIANPLLVGERLLLPTSTGENRRAGRRHRRPALHARGQQPRRASAAVAEGCAGGSVGPPPALLSGAALIPGRCERRRLTDATPSDSRHSAPKDLANRNAPIASAVTRQGCPAGPNIRRNQS